jgi:hypothetical protein
MKQLRKRIVRLLENGSVADENEHQTLEFLIKTKKWNCLLVMKVQNVGRLWFIWNMITDCSA